MNTNTFTLVCFALTFQAKDRWLACYCTRGVLSAWDKGGKELALSYVTILNLLEIGFHKWEACLFLFDHLSTADLLRHECHGTRLFQAHSKNSNSKKGVSINCQKCRVLFMIISVIGRLVDVTNDLFPVFSGVMWARCSAHVIQPFFECLSHPSSAADASSSKSVIISQHVSRK